MMSNSNDQSRKTARAVAPQSPPPVPGKPLTLFTWGYEGWGNAVPELLSATEGVERKNGFAAPVFVDVRYRRAVRAIGFREKAFEAALGPGRYHWMKSLGNANIGTMRGNTVRIAQPEAVNDLIDIALAAQAENRRVIFFCACGPLRAECHRHEVARLTVAAAQRRGIPLTIVAWPGGEPSTALAGRVTVPRTLLKALETVISSRRRIHIDQALVEEAAGWPWGTQLLADDGANQFLLAVGPAIPRAGRWMVPVCQWLDAENADANNQLQRLVMKIRDECGLAPRSSMIHHAV